MPDAVRSTVISTIDTSSTELHDINKKVHSHPETAYKEYYAHDTITAFLEARGFQVKRSTYNLPTSFEAEYGSGGRLVIVCAEYDALPEIGHACGHNLIATSSIATFLAVAEAIKAHGIKGRVRILGTPAEEGGGGKAKLIDAGAFKDEIAAAIMAHPVSSHQVFKKPGIYDGLAGFKLIASHKFRTEFRGKPAHAAGEPWNGVNALDAAVAAYTNVALLRQQMEPDERVHGVIEAGGTVPNVITEYTRMNWNVRSPTKARVDKLLDRVKSCLEAAAVATGCKIQYIVSPTYLNLRANRKLCETYARDMNAIGVSIQVEQEKDMNASTDMGNVSHIVPSFHGAFVIPTEPGVAGHNPAFAAAAGTDDAHRAALQSAKGMAMLALSVLVDDRIAQQAKEDFEGDDD
ncbi:metal-dependent amidase/aminoacylase/carboxypeptidase [Lophiotrema nucula]|uniref:Peptidase M20 domain-containing protein 2 n=1 Tax=Lophiotrema nucula TaxID=690887 RepID=A0A6A5ZEF7_9PLEO|nr:metal-dependent amidase/aminoacylase/carboxypeptidase [Lophiotrema nucula]